MWLRFIGLSCMIQKRTISIRFQPHQPETEDLCSMGREGLNIVQPVDQAIDVADWRGDMEFEIYPEGARDKSLLISPDQIGYDFLIPNHRYLFKHSFQHGTRSHPDQFWTEIIAYRIACILHIPVPPAFVGYDSKKNVCGAIIEWFLNYPDQPEERRVPGGDIMVALIPGYDRKKGKAHNFVAIERYLTVIDKTNAFQSKWQDYWCDMLLFDAIIGNTDRHQDNWEILWNQEQRSIRMSPVFDNGTSLGYEILESRMDDFYSDNKMKAYIKKGKHHLRWQLSDTQQCQHIDIIVRLLNRFPSLQDRVHAILSLYEAEKLRSILDVCRQYSVPVPLSAKRADFICHLVTSRVNAVKEELES